MEQVNTVQDVQETKRRRGWLEDVTGIRGRMVCDRTASFVRPVGTFGSTLQVSSSYNSGHRVEKDTVTNLLHRTIDWHV